LAAANALAAFVLMAPLTRGRFRVRRMLASNHVSFNWFTADAAVAHAIVPVTRPTKVVTSTSDPPVMA
jgi:hypothetical protein